MEKNIKKLNINELIVSHINKIDPGVEAHFSEQHNCYEIRLNGLACIACYNYLKASDLWKFADMLDEDATLDMVASWGCCNKEQQDFLHLEGCEVFLRGNMWFFGNLYGISLCKVKTIQTYLRSIAVAVNVAIEEYKKKLDDADAVCAASILTKVSGADGKILARRNINAYEALLGILKEHYDDEWLDCIIRIMDVADNDISVMEDLAGRQATEDDMVEEFKTMRNKAADKVLHMNRTEAINYILNALDRLANALEKEKQSDCKKTLNDADTAYAVSILTKISGEDEKILACRNINAYEALRNILRVYYDDEWLDGIIRIMDMADTKVSVMEDLIGRQLVGSDVLKDFKTIKNEAADTVLHMTRTEVINYRLEDK